MSSRRPEVFVSATSSDLRSSRQLIKEALLTLGCVPIEQTNFPPDYRSVREMLHARIASCDAVLHLAGEVYGAEPELRLPGEPRRSYTQMEYDLARELGKPLYTFVCDPGFAYDSHAPEDEDRQVLQQAHRAVLQSGEQLFYAIHSREDLALRVRELQTRVEALGHELRRTRTWLSRGVVTGLLAVALLGGGLWWLTLRTHRTEEHVTQLESELDRQRRYIRSIADAYTRQQTELSQLKLGDDQKFARALAAVARQEAITEESLRAGITLFVAATQADPKADFMDRALAEFARQNFSAAASSAGEAGRAALEQYAAAEQLSRRSLAQAEAARTRARQAFGLQGQALFASARFAEAAQAFQAGLSATSQAAQPQEWAEFQARLGQAADQWAQSSTGEDLLRCRKLALDSYRAALGSMKREDSPQLWAVTQHNYGIALERAAENCSSSERFRFLSEAVNAYHEALKVHTRTATPEAWAGTQNNLAIALRQQAESFDDARRLISLADSVTAYRAALEVMTPAAYPDINGQLQNNLASALLSQSAAAPASDRPVLLEQALAACYAALDVFTDEHLPQLWVAAQNNLANTFKRQADASISPEEQARLLGQAGSAYRAALTRCSREAQPREWSTLQNNLANLRQAQAALLPEGLERFELLREAISGYQGLLEVSTRASTPQDWAMTQNNLAIALLQIAPLVSEGHRGRALSDAVEALRATFGVYTREALPVDWARGHNNLAEALHAQAGLVTGAEQVRLLREAVQALQACLGVITPQLDPVYHAARKARLAAIEAELRKLPNGQQ